MPISKEDIASFVDGLEEWGKGQRPKDRKRLNWLVTRALGGDLKAADLDETNTESIGPFLTATMIKNARVINHSPTGLGWWVNKSAEPVGPYLLAEPVGPYLRKR